MNYILYSIAIPKRHALAHKIYRRMHRGLRLVFKGDRPEAYDDAIFRLDYRRMHISSRSHRIAHNLADTMKRYQCIKNWTFAGIHIFSQGTIYTSQDKIPLLSNGASIIDNTGACVEISDVTLHEFFHELMDLNVDENDNEVIDRYEQEATGCFRGAIWATLFITSGVVIYLALTWRS